MACGVPLLSPHLFLDCVCGILSVASLSSLCYHLEHVTHLAVRSIIGSSVSSAGWPPPLLAGAGQTRYQSAEQCGKQGYEGGGQVGALGAKRQGGTAEEARRIV